MRWGVLAVTLFASAVFAAEDRKLEPCPEGYVRKPPRDPDEAPPRLGRKPGATKPQPASEAETECVWSEVEVSPEGTVIGQPVRPPGSDPFLDEVAQEAFKFSETLPDFICTQLTERFESNSLPPKWNRRDRLSADVLYVAGREAYENLKRNGKPVEQSRIEQTGTWSAGEFGTLLQDIFSPGTDAKFEFTKVSHVGSIAAKHYDFSVRQKNSHWRVIFEGRELHPAYTGSVWIDPDTMRALRIEMQARNIPTDYPMTSIEMTVDYGVVEISGRQYLLPIKSENLACKRYSTRCSRNVIEFKDYRRFTTESNVTTTDSNVTFEGEEKKPEK